MKVAQRTEGEKVTARGAGAPLEAVEMTSRVDVASSALGHEKLGIEPAWAASGGQLLTLLGARAQAGEEEQPGPVSALIHEPQAWRGAAALCRLPECVIGNPLTDRLQEGAGGERAPAWKSSNWVLPVLFDSDCDC